MSLLIIIFLVRAVKAAGKKFQSHQEVTNWPLALYVNENIDYKWRKTLKLFIFYTQAVVVAAVFSEAGHSRFLC